MSTTLRPDDAPQNRERAPGVVPTWRPLVVELLKLTRVFAEIIEQSQQ